MIPDKEPVNTWNGNSSNITFDFDFLINSENELLVLHTDKTGIQNTLKLNIDYTIHQTGNADGSYITFPILGSSYKTLADGEKITLMLNIPIAQTSPYGTSEKLNLKSLEFSLDYIVRLIQIVNRKADRSVKVQEGSSTTPDDLIENLNQAQMNAQNFATIASNKANEANNSATKAENQATIATAKTLEVQETYEKAMSDISEKHTNAIIDIKNELNTAEDTIIADKSEALESISIAKENAVEACETEVQKAKGYAEAIGSSLLPLFSTFILDHILEDNDAIGWALQGSLITNVYPDAVNKIKELYSSGSETNYRGISCKKSKDGRYIADITQKDTIDNLFNTTGIADFYILDSSNNQFYLPRSRWFAQFTLDTNLVNSFNEAGLPNISAEFNGIKESNTGCVAKASGATSELTDNGSMNGGSSGTTKYCTYTFDASKSNLTYGNSETVQPASSNKLLYYKVGNTIVNESTIDVGNVLSELQLKADKDFSNVTKPYVKETYTNGTEGYRLYSDGWCIQWGYIACVAPPPVERTIFFLKEYKDTNYIYTEGVISDSQNMAWWFAHQAGAVKQKDTTGFTKLVVDTPLNPGTVGGYYWKTEGYIKG